MKKRLSILIILLLMAHAGYAQLSIEECYEMAEANYPMIRQYGLIEKTKEYNLSNASKGYLPQMQLNAKATYQSAVTQIPIDVEGVTGLSKDQYQATLDINQSIWDGGAIKSQKEIIRTQAGIDRQNLEVSLYAIRDRVNQLFFGILLYDETLAQNALYLEDLQRNYNEVAAYVVNGLANQADLDAVQIEQVKATQSQVQTIYNRNAYLEMLSVLIGEEVDENTRLIKPSPNQLYTNTIQRPELALYDAQFANLDAQMKEIKASLMPKLNVNLTGGYGRPGLNILENKFSAYYIAGLSFNWNLGNFYTRKNNLGKIEVNRGTIETQRETFLFNTELDMSQSGNEIRKYREILETDDEIIRLRASVRSASEAKVANGTLSVLDLMKEVNAEQTAIQDKILHEIQLLQSIYNMKYITNN
ncbi:MAG: TolC family protein [Tannerellaceae bacterium]|nr:TolC family protein [Tannerellaceae bacterium]